MQNYKWIPVSKILSIDTFRWYDYSNRTNSLADVYKFNKNIL